MSEGSESVGVPFEFDRRGDNGHPSAETQCLSMINY
jgi:hypothetical protein